MEKNMKFNAKNLISSQPQPSSVETERIVLGSLLLESSAIDRIAHFLKPEAFHNIANEKIYTGMISLYDRGVTVDYITVSKELKKVNGDKENFLPLLLELSTEVDTTANLEEHAQYLHQLMLARKMIVSCQSAQVKAFDQTYDIADTIEETLKAIEGITAEGTFGNEARSIGEAALKSVDMYGERKELAIQGLKSGIDTGLTDLNYVTNGGWKPGQLIILAARPAMGKTAMMLHFARQAALTGTPVMIFSLEMDAQALTNRVILSKADIDSHRFASGKLSDDEERALCNAADDLYDVPLMIDDSPNVSIQQIKIRARNAKRKGKCGLILIDYLQLIDMRSHNKAYNREQEVAQVSRAAKIMAKELNVPVILLSQLSRQVEGRAIKIPLLSDLRESGAIEQDADMVLFLHRPEYYDEPNAIKGEGIIRISKQRDGATGDVIFEYNQNLTRITGKGESFPSTPIAIPSTTSKSEYAPF